MPVKAITFCTWLILGAVDVESFSARRIQITQLPITPKKSWRD